MRIVDKKKDYYDFLVGKFGMDEKCVYVRDGVDIQAYIDYKMQSYSSCASDVIMAKKLWQMFRKEPLLTPQNMIIGRERPKYDDCVLEKSYNPLLHTYKPYLKYDEPDLHDGYYSYCSRANLIVGNTRYYLEVLRYLNNDGSLFYDMKWEKRELFVRKSVEPIYLDFGNCSVTQRNTEYTEGYFAENVIGNPLLKTTFIPSIIPPETIWIDVENYISSLNNDKIFDKMTNKEKILSHGFDLKTSFRNVK